MIHLIEPHGGVLQSLYVSDAEATRFKAQTREYPSWDLTPRQLCKSTIANALMVKLLELGGRAVTLLDGDIVRKHLSSELGFSREHRNIKLESLGYIRGRI